MKPESVLVDATDQNKCTICFTPEYGTQETKLMDIAGSIDGYKSCLDKIQELMHVDIILGYQKVCIECATKVNEAYTLQGQILEAITFWKRYFGYEGSSSLNEPSDTLIDTQDENISIEMSDVYTNSSNMPREQCSAEEKGKNDDNKFVQTDCTSIRKEDCGDRITIVSKAKHTEIEGGVGNGHGNPNYNKDDKSLMVLSSVENYTSFGGDETFYCNKLQKEKDYISEEISPDTIDTNNSEVVIKMKSEVLKELTIKPVVAAPGDTFEEYSKAMLRATVDDDEKQTLFCGRCKQYIADASEITTHFCVQRKTVERKNKYKQKRTVIEDSDCYGCAACGEMFKSKVDMDKHQEAHSIVKKVELVCNICNKSFINEKLLKLHSTKHTEGHNYRCHICGHTFKWRSSLNRHIRLHEGRAAKPFLCPICGKLFSSSDSKASHMRFHMGIKRYTCEICGKKFSECKHLRTHVRSHTGERPFACEFCFQSFSDKTTMRQHIRTKHKTDYYYETESAQLVETVS